MGAEGIRKAEPEYDEAERRDKTEVGTEMETDSTSAGILGRQWAHSEHT